MRKPRSAPGAQAAAHRILPVGIIYVVAAVLVWSGVPLLVKQVVPPFDARWVAFLRLALGAAFIAVAERVIGSRAAHGRVLRPRWQMRERALLLLAGAALAGDYVLYTLGISRTTASAGNLVVQVEILALALWGLLILKESAHRAKLAGMALCFSGVFLVGWNGQSLAGLARSQYFFGNLLVAVGGLCWSLYGLSQKLLLRTRGVGESVVPIMAVGAGIAACVALFAPPVARAPTALELAFVAALGVVCTGLGYLLMARGLQRLEASSVALLSTLLPLLTMTEAHFLLGERVSGYVASGAAFIVGGVMLMVGFGARAPSARPATPR